MTELEDITGFETCMIISGCVLSVTEESNGMKISFLWHFTYNQLCQTACGFLNQ
jgi:hypothetical protein